MPGWSEDYDEDGNYNPVSGYCLACRTSANYNCTTPGCLNCKPMLPPLLRPPVKEETDA